MLKKKKVPETGQAGGMAGKLSRSPILGVRFMHVKEKPGPDRGPYSLLRKAAATLHEQDIVILTDGQTSGGKAADNAKVLFSGECNECKFFHPRGRAIASSSFLIVST